MVIKVVDQVTTRDFLEEAWGLYSEAFRDLNSRAVQRHLMYRSEFDEVMHDRARPEIPVPGRRWNAQRTGHLYQRSDRGPADFAAVLRAALARALSDRTGSGISGSSPSIRRPRAARRSRRWSEQMYLVAATQNGLVGLDICNLQRQHPANVPGLPGHDPPARPRTCGSTGSTSSRTGCTSSRRPRDVSSVVCLRPWAPSTSARAAARRGARITDGGIRAAGRGHGYAGRWPPGRPAGRRGRAGVVPVEQGAADAAVLPVRPHGQERQVVVRLERVVRVQRGVQLAGTVEAGPATSFIRRVVVEPAAGSAT